jgi:hypothetical protein
MLETQTEPWGAKVTVVEIRDVAPPENLKPAMAEEAKAEREKRAKIIAADGEPVTHLDEPLQKVLGELYLRVFHGNASKGCCRMNGYSRQTSQLRGDTHLLYFMAERCKGGSRWVTWAAVSR